MEQESKQEEATSHLKTIEELKEKYGEEVVSAKVTEMEEHLKETITQLDERLFEKEINPEPEQPSAEEVTHIIALTTELYICEGRLLRLLDMQRHKELKIIPRELRMRLNNLFVNNRAVMDVLHKKFDWMTVEMTNKLADQLETMTNLFIASSYEDREMVIEKYKQYLIEQLNQQHNEQGSNKSEEEPSGDN